MTEFSWRRIAYLLAFCSAVTILVSIAVSQILLALSLAALLLSGERLRVPPFRAPLFAFALTTVLALLFSGDVHSGTPQIRKFFVFGIVLVIYSTFKILRQIIHLTLAWVITGSLSALWAVGQYLERSYIALEQHADYYGFVLDGRITGFMNHWATFGGEEMIVFLILASRLILSKHWKWKYFGGAALIVLWIAITLGMTRSVFLLGLPVGLSYLLWCRKPLLVSLIPLAFGIVIVVAPMPIHERISSVLKPHGDMDSNAQRAICRAVGWNMVKAHPWFGLGPEQVGKQFERYLPANMPGPLPKGWYGHLHNVYLQYAAERGIPCLLSFVWVIAKVILDFRRFLRQKTLAPGASVVLQGAIAVIFAVLAEGLFDYNLGDSEVLTMFLAVIACGYIAGESAVDDTAVKLCKQGHEIAQSRGSPEQRNTVMMTLTSGRRACQGESQRASIQVEQAQATLPTRTRPSCNTNYRYYTAVNFISKRQSRAERLVRRYRLFRLNLSARTS